ncbi:MAG TPA: hypothetical protein VJK51_00285 [Candidatus Nanoarchaeia archaeon]|nr:hypothetical protein [Candidatus Nanoarchaeia archaeon]
MEREDITLLAQLLSSIKDSLTKLEQARKSKNNEAAASIKKEIIHFQKQIDAAL